MNTPDQNLGQQVALAKRGLEAELLVAIARWEARTGLQLKALYVIHERPLLSTVPARIVGLQAELEGVT